MEKNEFDGLIARLKKEAEAGDSTAMKHLGDAYYQGSSGKGQDIAAALPYWKCAVDNGELSIAYKVGTAYLYGHGCQKDETTAFHYLLLSANSGNLAGQFAIGYCYENGIGCKTSMIRAKEYYEKAALRGHGQAQWRLGALLLTAKEENGLHWICCAHLSGVKDATDTLNDFISNGMSREGIEYQLKRIKEKGVDPKNSGIPSSSSSSEGCYVATCIYGSYDCPQVWTLRRFRDYTLKATWYGRLFIRVYYAISPILVHYFGNTAWFRNLCSGKLNRLVATLQERGIECDPYQDEQ
ncbi:MAG: sel1 repeat family protein [Lachnospiraceae bacterium]|nr:sel1 repeat family protein [Lachnospiraceae bacterium]